MWFRSGRNGYLSWLRGSRGGGDFGGGNGMCIGFEVRNRDRRR